jgi:hypothetical protein
MPENRQELVLKMQTEGVKTLGTSEAKLFILSLVITTGHEL